MENSFFVDSEKLSPAALEKKHRLENDPSSRTNHMEYMEGMEVIKSDICEKVMSKVFRGKFLYYLKQEKLDFYGKNKYLENPASYNDLIQKLYNKDWIVYCKEPFNNADCVIQYLGRYTHRVAI